MVSSLLFDAVRLSEMGMALALIALALATAGVGVSIRAVVRYATWPTTTGVVQAVEVSSLAKPAIRYASVRIELSYRMPTLETSAWATRYGPWNGEEFTRQYAVGTRHRIWVNPGDFTEAEVSWGSEMIATPLVFLALSWGFMAAALGSWRAS
jgi:Protein of unknown function (DUF3592)